MRTAAQRHSHRTPISCGYMVITLVVRFADFRSVAAPTTEPLLSGKPEVDNPSARYLDSTFPPVKSWLLFLPSFLLRLRRICWKIPIFSPIPWRAIPITRWSKNQKSRHSRVWRRTRSQAVPEARKCPCACTGDVRLLRSISSLGV